MAKCSRCGVVETSLYINSVPVCLECEKETSTSPESSCLPPLNPTKGTLSTDHGLRANPSKEGELGNKANVDLASPIENELTERQREILLLVCDGLSNKEIGHRLGITIKTVEFHRSNIKRVVGEDSTAKLVRWAIQQRIIEVSFSRSASERLTSGASTD